MSIERLTEGQLSALEENYLRAKRTEGGIYSLSQVRLEKLRRNPSPFDIREVASRIIELARNSSDGLLTYGELWTSFRPNERWEGHKTLSIMSKTLGRVISYCVRNKLPILTVLVVQAANRQLSAAAIENIYNECRGLGVDAGSDSQAFVHRQVSEARSLAVDSLPADAPPDA